MSHNSNETHYVSFLSGQDGAMGAGPRMRQPSRATSYSMAAQRYFMNKRFKKLRTKLPYIITILGFVIGFFCLAFYMLWGGNNPTVIPSDIPVNPDVVTLPDDIFKWEAGHYEFAFADFMKKYSKSYASMAEKIKRFNIFKVNVVNIYSHNAQDSDFKMGINAFADMTWKEFRARFLGYKEAATRLEFNANLGVDRSLLDSNITLPKRVDWREQNCVTPIKNQGECGSCWSFSATGAIEGAWCKKTGKLISLSEQMLMDCSTENNGCNGGLMDKAFDYVAEEGGICTEEDYPYIAGFEKCKSKKCKHEVKIEGYKSVPANNEVAMKAALAQNSPVSVAVCVSTSFQFYRSGVFSERCCNDLDHGVLLVGYDTDHVSHKDYFILKNSWGAEWGESGYMLIAQHMGAEGQCGVLMSGVFPVA